jgi:soluble lytic murein transglycosylase
MAGTLVVRRVVLVSLAILLLLYAVLVGLRLLWPLGFTSVLAEAAAAYGVDPDLIAAVTYAESRFRPDAVSPRGAIGLMQIMPATGSWIAEQMGLPAPTARDLFDAERNVRFGSWYLRYLLDRFGDVETALRAYNAGPAAAERWRDERTDPHPETTAFVRRVLAARPIYRFYFRCPVLTKISPAVFL